MKRKNAIGFAICRLAVLAVGIGLYRLGTMTLTSIRKALEATSGFTGSGALRYFSHSYRAAREKLLEAARAAGGIVESIQNPHAGPDGEPIFMDVVLVGAGDAKRFLVLISGTHGVEGFAGSGIQTGLLREGIGSRLPAGTSLLLIHAMNPYGMAHLRRFNEDNVDLNRNFGDHTGPHPANPPYDKLADVIAPQSLSFWSEVASWSRVLWSRLTAGEAALQAAVSGGQYAHPDGLFYGGTNETWSNRTFRSVVRRYLDRASQVVVVDVHTGLGSSGAAEIILDVPDTSAEYHRGLTIWGPASVTTTASGNSLLPTTLNLEISRMLRDAEVTAGTREFGTFPPMEAFKALRAENWLHHHGGISHPKALELKTWLARTFHPDSEQWEASVWRQGNQVVQKALASLSP